MAGFCGRVHPRGARVLGAAFTGSTQWRRGKAAWEESGLPGKPLSLHEARHTFVSLMHDAEFTLERIGDYVEHSSACTTDRYRHLLEGHEAEAAAKFDAYWLA